MVSAFDGRINDQEELKDPGKSRPSTAMTSDFPADTTAMETKKDLEKAEEVDDGEGCYDSRPRTPIVTGPIIELRGREVIFAIGVFFLFAIVVGLVVVLASSKMNTPSNSSESEGNSTTGLCDVSPPAVLTAAGLLQNMNLSVDPCEDFWEYSCGGWLDRVEIPATVDSVGVDRDLNSRIRSDIKAILEDDLKRDSVQSAERKFKALYRTCMNIKTIESLGSEPILSIIRGFGGWAFLPDWKPGGNSGQWSILQLLSEVHFTYDVEAFFSVVVGSDDKNSSINILQFDQGGLGLPNREEYLKEGGNSTLVRAYKKYMATIARLFNASEERVQDFVESTFGMERKLAELHKTEHSQERRDSASMYNMLNISRLQQIAPRINWTQFLRSAFSSVSEDTPVLVTSEEYLANISSLISSSDERDVSNYLLWRLMSEFGALLLSTPFQNAYNEFKRPSKDTPTDTPRTSNRHTYCQKVVIEWFGLAITAEYVRMKNFDGRETEILEMIANIKAMFRETVRDSDWMDNDTIANALDKLDRMQERVGYPHFILNNTELDDYYNGFEANANDTFFSNILGGLRHQKRKRSDALELNVQTEDWSMDPLEVNAFYSMTENVVGFTAGLLQKPFYDKTAPNYVNYATLGSTVAHEIIHGFDEAGSVYDSEGNLIDWWTEDTKNDFTTRTKCVENYYGSLSVNGIEVSGLMTLNENLADIGGLKHAYKAYKNWEKAHQNQPEQKLPGMKLTNDEVFFVAFAQNWCKSRRKESIEKFMSRSIHSIEEIRVRGTLSQVEDFASVFECRLGSPMNPPNKCKVW